MEWDISSWDEDEGNMIMPTSEKMIGTRKLPENRPVSEKKRAAGDRAPECLPTVTSPNLTESIQSLREERDTVRAAHAKLQQAIYEAAQVQRRLCAPRELVSGEFEIAGEIFPAGHLSGGFLQVMHLDP